MTISSIYGASAGNQQNVTPAILSSTIDSNGNLVLVYANGAVVNVGHVVGRDGATGPQGAPGPKGDKGDQGPAGTPGAKGDPGQGIAVNYKGPLSSLTQFDNVKQGFTFLDIQSNVLYIKQSDNHKDWREFKYYEGPQGLQGPQGAKGDSAYQSWLNLGNTGTEQDFIDSLIPLVEVEEIAAEVAPILDISSSPLTAEGTETLSKPDTMTGKRLARRVAYVGAAKVATVVLADGDNLITHVDLSGDAVDFNSISLYPRILRGTVVISPEWSVEPGDKILIKSAVAGDVLHVCQYDVTSERAVKNVVEPLVSAALAPVASQAFEALRRSYEEAGYNVVGTFREGFTIVNANDVGIDETTGKGFTGPVGLVAAGTNPSSGGFVDRSAETLRHILALNTGAGMVVTADGRTVQERFDNIDAEVDAAGTAASLIAQHNASAVAHPAVSESITPVGDVAILDLASATVFRVTLTAHITQIGFANASSEDGSSRSVTLILRQGTGVNLVSWPENIRWAYDHLPVLSYEKDAEDYITLVRFGADAHWYGFLTGGWFHV